MYCNSRNVIRFAFALMLAAAAAPGSGHAGGMGLLGVVPEMIAQPVEPPPPAGEDWTPAPAVFGDLQRHGMGVEGYWQDAGKRHLLINARAKLISLGLWGRVSRFGLAGWKDLDDPNRSPFWALNENYKSADGEHEPFTVAFKYEGDVQARCASWSSSCVGHPEAAWSRYEPGNLRNYIVHFLGAKKCAAGLTLMHFDADGAIEHTLDWVSGWAPNWLKKIVGERSVTADEVTEQLYQLPGARPYLFGISKSYDEFLWARGVSAP